MDLKIVKALKINSEFTIWKAGRYRGKEKVRYNWLYWTLENKRLYRGGIT